MANHLNIFAILNPTNTDLLEREIYIRVKEGLHIRVELFNQILEGTEIDTSEVKKKLRYYLEDPLLTADIETFKELRTDGIDHEFIEDFKIEELNVVEQEGDTVQLEVAITWFLQGMEEFRQEKTLYHMVMVRKGEDWFLKDYYPIS